MANNFHFVWLNLLFLSIPFTGIGKGHSFLSIKLVRISVFAVLLGACDSGSKEIGISPSNDALDQRVFAYLLNESGIAFYEDDKGYFYINNDVVERAERLMRRASSKSGQRIGLIASNECERFALGKLLDSQTLPYVVDKENQMVIRMLVEHVEQYQISGRFALIKDRCSDA